MAQIDQYLKDRIFEVENTIELYNRCIKSEEETIFINTRNFMSSDELDEQQKKIAEVRLSIYRNVVNDILIPTKNNYMSMLKSWYDGL